MPAPGEPLFLPEDTLAVIALAQEEADTCPKCGMPKAWCRDNKVGRARFDVADEFCWATYRVTLRQEAQDKEKAHPSTRAASIFSATFNKGYVPELTDGLELNAATKTPQQLGTTDRPG